MPTLEELKEARKVLDWMIEGKRTERRAKDMKGNVVGDWGANEWFPVPRYYEYRLKPEPRVVWVNEYPDNDVDAYSTETQARMEASYAEDGEITRIAIPFREVMEGE